MSEIFSEPSNQFLIHRTLFHEVDILFKFRQTLLHLLALLLCSTAYAGGFRLVDQDPYATARGNAYTATADRASSVYYNPAGMTQIESREIHLGYHLVHFDVDVEHQTAGSTSNRSKFLGPPQFFAVAPVNDLNITAGLALYSPFGLGLEYPDDTGFRTLSTKAELVYLTFAPSLALEITDYFSIGASLNINFADLSLATGSTPDQNSPELEIDADGVSTGFTLGALLRLGDTTRLGARYVSPSYIDMEGTASLGEQSGDTSFQFPLPDFFTIGLAHDLTDKLSVEFNYDWTNWDRFDQITFETEILGPIVNNPRYSASSIVNVGLTYSFSDKTDFNLGYYFSENSVPSSSFEPSVPDLDKHYLGIGISQRLADIQLTLAYQYAFSESRRVKGSPQSPTGESADGEYEVAIHAMAVAVNYSF